MTEIGFIILGSICAIAIISFIVLCVFSTYVNNLKAKKERELKRRNRNNK